MHTDTHKTRRTQGELSLALRRCRSAFLGVAVLSGLLNVLYLTGSFFMLQVYDRVLPSRSIPTLVGLCVIALVLYAFQGLMDVLRARILTRVGGALDEELSGRCFQIGMSLPLISPSVDSAQPSRDLDTVRGFLSGTGPSALFDLPWLPLYLAICFAFHPAIGWTALAGGAILVALTFMTERLTKGPVQRSAQMAQQRAVLVETARRNAEAARSMGMGARLAERWLAANGAFRAEQARGADIGAALGAFSKTFRMVLQSAVLAVGAYLVVNQQASGGIIIASSILSARALAPIELAISQWKGFVAARYGWNRLSALLETIPVEATPLPLPKPERDLVLQDVVLVPPGSAAATVHGASLRLEAGQGLGVIGPSASGKSSLIRALVGAWKPERGTVRLDNASLDQWSPERLGAHVGYLPQDVQLFAGTIAGNIARFDETATAEAVIEAARAAGVHEMILRLPAGYETEVGEAGQALSAGQRQRVGLARALFGRPFLVVLDEPNSNLDGEGEEALTHAIMSVRLRGGIAVVVAHRPSALTALNLVLVMQEGRVAQFGSKEEVLGIPMTRNPTAAPAAAATSDAPEALHAHVLYPTLAGAA